MTEERQGVPASELSDQELESQGKRAHETRNWVFLHGSAEQFAHHTARMLELEREYVRRYPKRTWQGSGGAATDLQQTAASWRETVRGVIAQLEALVELPDPSADGTGAGPADPVRTWLQCIADNGGRMNKLEAHQIGREVGLDPAVRADLYKADPPLVATEGTERVLTDAGRARLADRAGTA